MSLRSLLEKVQNHGGSYSICTDPQEESTYRLPQAWIKKELPFWGLRQCGDGLELLRG
jgi:hypothetical protein